MIKKAIAAVAMFAVLGTVWAIDPGGHVSTMFGYVSKAWEPSLEYEIDRAETLVERLDGENGVIADHRQTLAREKVLLGKLDEKLVEYREDAAREQSKLVAMRDRINDDQLVSLDESASTALQRQLNRARFTHRKAVSTQRQYDARKKRFDAMRDKVAAMDAQLADAKLALETMKAELAAVQVDEMYAKQSIDDTEFARVQKLLDKIDTEIKTRQELSNMRAGNYGDEDEERPEPTVTSTDVLNEVDAYLQGNNGPRIAGK